MAEPATTATLAASPSAPTDPTPTTPARSGPVPPPPARTIAALLRWGQARLQASAAQTGAATNARLESELLLTTATGLGRTQLIAWPERQPSEPARLRFARMIDRRDQGEPIAYILGEREFRGLPFYVTPATLIPRPETELLVDWVLARYSASARIHCADLGTGSGAIALAIAARRPGWRILALDRSAAALAVAAANRRRLQAKQVWLVQGDWLGAIAKHKLDVIVANPPYVASRDPHLARGDVRFEPSVALVGGADGLAAIRRLAPDLPSGLAPGGRVAMEHGWNQGASVRAILRQAGLKHIRTHRDLAGHERFTSAARDP